MSENTSAPKPGSAGPLNGATIAVGHFSEVDGTNGVIVNVNGQQVGISVAGARILARQIGEWADHAETRNLEFAEASERDHAGTPEPESTLSWEGYEEESSKSTPTTFAVGDRVRLVEAPPHLEDEAAKWIGEIEAIIAVYDESQLFGVDDATIKIESRVFVRPTGIVRVDDAGTPSASKRAFDPTKPVKTRDGQKVYIVRTDGDDVVFPIEARVERIGNPGVWLWERYTAEGCYFADGAISVLDLVNVDAEPDPQP